MRTMTEMTRRRTDGNRRARRVAASRRRTKLLAIHAGVFVLVNGFMVGTWAMTKLAPAAPVDRRSPEGFWPGWLIVTWGSLLGLHGLYVWARRGGRTAPGRWAADGRPRRMLATVLFTDIVGSTERAAELGDSRWRDLLAEHNRLVRRELERHRGREVGTAGDGFLATFDGPVRAIRCALAVREAVRALRLDIRAGIHTGEIELMNGNVGGIGVHIAARVAAAAEAGEVVVSRTVTDLVAGAGIAFEDHGLHTLKGIDGDWRLFAVVG